MREVARIFVAQRFVDDAVPIAVDLGCFEHGNVLIPRHGDVVCVGRQAGAVEELPASVYKMPRVQTRGQAYHVCARLDKDVLEESKQVSKLLRRYDDEGT